MFPKDTAILIVDDMTTMRKMIKKSLMELGYSKFAEAENGDVALQKFNQALETAQSIGLILSDWNMPVMTGIALLKAVRSAAKGSTTPFVLLTAESEKSQVFEAIQLKVNGYIVKPFTTQSLCEKLEGVYKMITQKKAA